MPKISPDPAIDINAIPLRPEEQLISAQRIVFKKSSRPPNAIEALQLLAGVNTPEDIGEKGPIIASRASKENEEHPELRLYEVVFGRDSLIAARFLLQPYPELAKNTLLYLAQVQGVEFHKAREEEVGKIVHEARPVEDPIAQKLTKELGWQWPYYGSIDATLLYVLLLLDYTKQYDSAFLQQTYTDRQGTNRTMLHSLEMAIHWVKNKMDSNPEGLIESLRLNTQGGLINQGWKDSRDSYHHANGTLADHTKGVASIEIQALAYDALLNTADIYSDLTSAAPVEDTYDQEIIDIKQRAEKIKNTILNKFWITDDRGSYFALGTDRDENNNLRPLQVRTSNMGHVLNSQLLDDAQPNMKEALVKTLTAPDMLNVSGIRTLSALENRFRPNSYHNGAVWPWDTYEIARGLRRQGYTALAQDLCQKILGVTSSTACFPEFVSGDDGSQPKIPERVIKVHDKIYNFEHAIEQPPQEIQAWTVAAVASIEFSSPQ